MSVFDPGPDTGSESAPFLATAAAWFQKATPARLTAVAYFSMEFMLGEALPIYSGGLGNVAGDQLEVASDLGVPSVGVGLLYQEGYFRQAITADGSQLVALSLTIQASCR